MGQERRKYTRVSVERLLKCEKYSIPRLPEQERQQLTTKNLSGGGLLFVSKQQLKLGDLLRLEIDLSGWEKYKPEFYKPEATASSKPLVILASVTRIEALNDGTFEIGVAFSGMDEGHRVALVKFLKAQK
ncbi:MAG: PilZ domain-containing protein [Elusimicrobia bacterium]|nr:PilZ domain-containing protein [Elusimicrobiota bacterium]